MKKSTLIFFVALLGVALLSSLCDAQTKADTVYVKLHKNQLAGLQQVLGFSYQWLPKSQAPAIDVANAQDVIKNLYPALVADTVKKVKPVIKK